MLASAPGKVLWAGEYAVLDGWPAIVSAIDRRVTAEVLPYGQALSPFLAAARAEVAAHFGEQSREARAAACVHVDSSALQDDGRKLGLGSSAATTVAAVAAALGRTDRPFIHELAHRAHAAAQEARGARGSGADVAASVFGGLLRVEQIIEGAPLATQPLPWPDGLTIVYLWTGEPADTATLVAQVRGYRERDREGHRLAMNILGDAAGALADALGADAQAVLAALDAAAQAFDGLAALSGAPLLPACLPAARALASAHGGVVKPTGAGGGDLLLAAFADPEAGARFAAAAAGMGMKPVEAGVDRTGVQLADEPEPA